MEEASFFDTSQSIYQTTRHHILQNGCLHNYHLGNLKSCSGQSARYYQKIFDIQEYHSLRYLEEHDQLNDIALHILPHRKRVTIFVTKISSLKMFAKMRNV